MRRFNSLQAVARSVDDRDIRQTDQPVALTQFIVIKRRAHSVVL
jgi:hypothetical protein